MEAIRRLFSPEFRNRLDAVIQFGGLDQDTIERVVDKLLVEAEAQLEQKRVSISVDEPARRWIAKRGYDPKMGARPMARSFRNSSSGRSPRSCCSANSSTADTWK
jgi:ATP-dependent Clp protease ATP-binding subunit ClpA